MLTTSMQNADIVELARVHQHACRNMASLTVTSSFQDNSHSSLATLLFASRSGCAPAHEILPDLWLGSEQAAKDPSWLISRGIYTVINCALEVTSLPHYMLLTSGVLGGVHLLPLIDCSTCLDDLPYFAQALAAGAIFVSKALLQGPVLVHCAKGISRSAAVVVAALLVMQRPGISTLVEALLFVKNRRPCARPNAAFLACLIAMEPFLRRLCCEASGGFLCGDALQTPAMYLHLDWRSIFAKESKKVPADERFTSSFPIAVFTAHPDTLAQLYSRDTGELMVTAAGHTWPAAAMHRSFEILGGTTSADMFGDLLAIEHIVHTRWPTAARPWFLLRNTRQPERAAFACDSFVRGLAETSNGACRRAILDVSDACSFSGGESE
jgi:hypothetical protein